MPHVFAPETERFRSYRAQIPIQGQPLRDVGGVTVTLRAETNCKLTRIDLDPAETELAKTFGEGADMPTMLAAAETYLSVGNYWAVRRVLDAVPEKEQARSPRDRPAQSRLLRAVERPDPSRKILRALAHPRQPRRSGLGQLRPGHALSAPSPKHIARSLPRRGSPGRRISDRAQT